MTWEVSLSNGHICVVVYETSRDPDLIEETRVRIARDGAPLFVVTSGPPTIYPYALVFEGPIGWQYGNISSGNLAFIEGVAEPGEHPAFGKCWKARGYRPDGTPVVVWWRTNDDTVEATTRNSSNLMRFPAIDTSIDRQRVERDMAERRKIAPSHHEISARCPYAGSTTMIVEFSPPGGTLARKYGYGPEGCYVVILLIPCAPHRIAYGGFATRDEANEYVSSFKLKKLKIDGGSGHSSVGSSSSERGG